MLEVAKYLIKQVTETQKTFELKLIDIYGYFYIGSYILLRYYGYGIGGFRYDPVEIVYTLHSFFKGYISSIQFVKFVAAGVYDYKRKRMLLAQCTGLISKVDRKLLFFDDKIKPLLDMNDKMTILSWYYLRRTFLDFGRKYTLRVFLYASLILPICIFIIIVLFLQVIGIIGVTYNYYIVPGILLSIEIFALLIHMSLSALSLNNYFAIHKDLMLERCSQLKREDDDQEILKACEFVIRRLEHDEIVRPIKIMGVKIDNSFMVQLGALAISGIYALVNLLMH